MEHDLGGINSPWSSFEVYLVCPVKHLTGARQTSNEDKQKSNVSGVPGNEPGNVSDVFVSQTGIGA